MNAWRRALAPAKLNLRLEVLGKRPDGYHELVTELLTIDLADELRARRVEGSGLLLRLGGPALAADVPADERNLAYRAARLAQDEALRRGSTAVGLELELVKHIPSQAGLGGASSDAAAALLLTDVVLCSGLERSWMGDRLAELGSDCRFFLDAPHGLARGTGRGERIEPLECALPPCWIALATPDARCSTPAVFDALRLPPEPLASQAPLGTGLPADLARGNQLEAAAFAACPELERWREPLEAAGEARWQLTGSGSSLFAAFSAEEDARRALDRLRARGRERGLELRLGTVVQPAGTGVTVLE